MFSNNLILSNMVLFPVYPRRSAFGSRKIKQICAESIAPLKQSTSERQTAQSQQPKMLFLHRSVALHSRWCACACVCVFVWVLENQYFDSGSKLLEVVERLKVNATLMHQQLQQTRHQSSALADSQALAISQFNLAIISLI